MPNGRPHDNPLTDLLVHGMHPFPDQVEKLILELHRLDPTALANSDAMLADWEQGTEHGIKWLREKVSEQKDGNNVYSKVYLKGTDLQCLIDAVQNVTAWERVRIKSSDSYPGAKRVQLDSPIADFESFPLHDDDFDLFNGAVAGDIPHVCEFVERLSAALSAAGIAHRFEVHDEQQVLVKEIGE